MEFAFVGTQAGEWTEWESSSLNIEVEVDEDSEGAVVGGRVHLADEETPTFVSPRLLIESDGVSGGVIDIAQDDCGTLYILSGSGELYTYDAVGDRLQRLRCSEDNGRFGEPRSLCVTEQSIYIGYRTVGAKETTGRIRALSKYLRQTRWVTEEVRTSDDTQIPLIDPIRIDGEEEGLFVLDSGVDETNPGNGSSGRLAELHPNGTAEVVIQELAAPSDVARDDAGRIYVLLGRGSGAELTKYDPDFVELDDNTVEGPITRFDIACIDVGEEDQLVAGVLEGTEAEKSLFRFRLDAEPGRFEPVLSFKHTCERLLLGSGFDDDGKRVSGLYAVDGAEQAVYFLAVAHRTRRNNRTGRYDGQVMTRLNSGIHGVEWHRVTLEFALAGSDTQVRLRYHATDDENETLTPQSDLWTELGRPNPVDALLGDATGQYLWVAIDLVGVELASPTVEIFRAYFPRQSYLRYLPAIYNEDEESSAFLERFLSLFETVFADIEEEIDHVTRYLDAEGIPETYLSWLEGWLALETDETWPEQARRDLIEQAPMLFQKRGTRNGLSALLRIYLERIGEESTEWRETVEQADKTVEESATARSARLPQCEQRADRDEEPTDESRERLRARVESPAYIREYASLDCIDSDEVREPFERLLDCPQCFLVLVRPFVTDEQLRTVQRLVDAERPAHTVGRAVKLRPRILLGGHAYLGVNSVLPDSNLVVGRAGLGMDSRLDERESHTQLDVRSRLEEDTILS